MRDSDIYKIKRKSEKKLLKLAGVVGVGVGKESDEEVIVVMTDNLPPKSADKIPGKIENYRVVLRETGEIKAL